MDEKIVMFALQGGLSVVMILLGFVMNGMRTSIDRVSVDLKELNNAVLGKYIPRDEFDARLREQRTLDHELRGMIQKALVDIAGISGKPYMGPQ